jgi:hypothetical protein
MQIREIGSPYSAYKRTYKGMLDASVKQQHHSSYRGLIIGTPKYIQLSQ